MVLLVRRRSTGITMILAGLILSYLLSIPITASLFAQLFQQGYPPLSSTELSRYPADTTMIVVLAGGLDPEAPEYAQDTLHLRTLGRLRYGARLARISNLPVLVSGGIRNTDIDYPPSPREAEVMAQALREEYGIHRVWTETRSRNTWQNAVYSTAILRSLGISRIILVTQAAHMPRAAESFEKQGLEVIPASTLYFPTRLEPGRIGSWLPSAGAIATINFLCHEWLGIWYYRLVLQRRSPPDTQEGSLLRS